MKMIEIMRNNAMHLIKKSVVEVNKDSHEENYFVHLNAPRLIYTFRFQSAIAANKFYQEIRKSLLSEEKINVIVYDEEKGVL